MAGIKITWLSDCHRCETCGSSYAEGARVEVDGKVVVEMLPRASCFGGSDHDPSAVYAAIFEHLGHSLSEEQTQ